MSHTVSGPEGPEGPAGNGTADHTPGAPAVRAHDPRKARRLIRRDEERNVDQISGDLLNR